jgi:hypothetical protein
VSAAGCENWRSGGLFRWDSVFDGKLDDALAGGDEADAAVFDVEGLFAEQFAAPAL